MTQVIEVEKRAQARQLQNPDQNDWAAVLLDYHKTHQRLVALPDADELRALFDEGELVVYELAVDAGDGLERVGSVGFRRVPEGLVVYWIHATAGKVTRSLKEVAWRLIKQAGEHFGTDVAYFHHARGFESLAQERGRRTLNMCKVWALDIG